MSMFRLLLVILLLLWLATFADAKLPQSTLPALPQSTLKACDCPETGDCSCTPGNCTCVGCPYHGTKQQASNLDPYKYQFDRQTGLWWCFDGEKWLWWDRNYGGWRAARQAALNYYSGPSAFQMVRQGGFFSSGGGRGGSC